MNTKNKRESYDLLGASSVLKYELDMLHATAKALSIPREWAIKNALIESFALHTRNLIEFLYKSNSKKWSPKIKPEDFVNASSSNWNRPELRNDYDSRFQERNEQASIQVAHMIVDRIGLQPDEKDWDLFNIIKTLQEDVGKFLSEVPENLLDEDVLEYRR